MEKFETENITLKEKVENMESKANEREEIISELKQ